MTINEARAYLSLSAETENIQELYDEYLFEQKLYFRNKPAIKSVFLKKISKIELAKSAFEVLGIKDSLMNFPDILWNFNRNILSNFHEYHQKKNTILQLIFNSKELTELMHITPKLVDLEISYSLLWSKFDVHIEKKSVVDPMKVLSDLKKLETRNIKNYIEFHPEVHKDLIYLYAEIARLSMVNR